MDWLDEATKPVFDQLSRMGRSKLAGMYRNCFRSTWDTTLQRSDGTVFLVTGDIPAMWLRDSSAQVYHYLPHAGKYPDVREAILGLLERQFRYIVLDPYANAFNREANDRRNHLDDTSWTEEARPWIWERKYEVDSLCYPIRLSHHFWKTTGDSSWCNGTFLQAAEQILTVWETEQRHMENSPYHFSRGCRRPTDTLCNGGMGATVSYTGMTWSGFRPSDDACTYGYLIPANFFAVKSLEQMAEMLDALRPEAAELSARARKLREQIQAGLSQYAVFDQPEFGPVYAYEVDGLGNAVFMDDANVPSLLSLPYLGCVKADDPIYQNTRRMLLSPANPYILRGDVRPGHRQPPHAGGLYLAHFPVHPGADSGGWGRNPRPCGYAGKHGRRHPAYA
jgi:meiotically up-regulated gene 157 (Mug157) protein